MHASPSGGRSFRDQIKDLMVHAFGAPQALPTESGALFRWVLPRKGGLHVHIYITLDSPELPDQAHILISDPSSAAVNPVTSLTVRTMGEVHALIERIRDQVRP